MKKTLKFEILEISQEKAIQLGLKLHHLILIDYLFQFFSSGNSKIIYKTSDEPYFYITLNKILSDLPILNIKKRRLQELISELEDTKVIQRYSSKTSPCVYIKLNVNSILW